MLKRVLLSQGHEDNPSRSKKMKCLREMFLRKSKNVSNLSVDKLNMKPIVILNKLHVDPRPRKMNVDDEDSQLDKDPHGLLRKLDTSSTYIEETKLEECRKTVDLQLNTGNNLLIEGNLVWAKLAKKDSLWPAIVLNAETAGLTTCSIDQCCVFWLKDNRVSKVPIKYVEGYTSHVPNLKLMKNEIISRKEAIYESIDIFAERNYNIALQMKNDDKLQWLKRVVGDRGLMKAVLSKLEPKKQENTPKCAAGGLDQEDYINNLLPHLRLQHKENGNLAIPDHIWAFIKKIQKKIKSAEVQLRDQERKKDPHNFCLVCVESTEFSHPLFNAKLCMKCRETYLDNFFIYDLSKKDKKYCVICGQNEASSGQGNIWVFCDECVQLYFQLPISEILKNLKCVIKNECRCKSAKKHNNNLLKVDLSWWDTLSSLYFQNKNEVKDVFENYSNVICLTLGAGNGTININKFPLNNQNTKIRYINILSMKDKKKKDIEINSLSSEAVVLLTGSAINTSESWVMLEQNGKYDQEVLFMEFYNFYRRFSLQRLQMHWIFECSAAIKSRTRQRNSRFLEVDPILIDTHKNCRDSRYRMVWTNILGSESFFKSIMNI